MSEEELEKTGILKDMLEKEDEEEMTINEMIEEFLEQLDYLEMDEKKKLKLKSLAKQIQEEQDEKAKEFLFNELKKIANEQLSFSLEIFHQTKVKICDIINSIEERKNDLIYTAPTPYRIDGIKPQQETDKN